ncbi:ComEC/Rec2 family competence protein, partial [bacterium]|nr:ComEC/Rec2 family competence protein [bacterium]
MRKIYIKFPFLVTIYLISHFIPLYIPLIKTVWYITLLSSFLLIISILTIKKLFGNFFDKYRDSLNFLIEILILFCFLSFGAFQGDSTIHPQYNSKSLFSYQFEEEISVEGVIIDKKIKKDKTDFIVEVKKIYKNQLDDIIEIGLEGKITLFLSWESNLDIGDSVIFRGELNPPSTAQNYGEFDYRGYLKTIEVSHIVFLKNSFQIEKISNNLSFIKKLKLNIVKFLEKNLSKYDKNGIFKAVLLGEKSSMDSQFKERLIDGGMIHLFTISGFHIAIFYLMLYRFFLFLLRLNINIVRKISIKKSAILLSLIVILGYVWLLDFQIAAFRAFLMLMIFGVDRVFERDSSFINKLCFSAFIILLLMPDSAFSVGFYLSFSAVLGIYYAQNI